MCSYPTAYSIAWFTYNFPHSWFRKQTRSTAGSWTQHSSHLQHALLGPIALVAVVLQHNRLVLNFQWHATFPPSFELESIPHNRVSCPNVSHPKSRLFVKCLELGSVAKWGVTPLQLTSYASFSDLQLSFSPPENCVGY